MRKALIALYLLVSTLELLGSLVFAVGFWTVDPKWFLAGINIALVSVAVSEAVKYFCRGSDERFDAYVAALEVPPLPGRAWHWLRSFARGYRLQEVR